MNEYTIHQYVEKFGQSDLAKALSITQGAVSQMLASKREIFIRVDGSNVSGYEIKAVPSKKHQAA